MSKKKLAGVILVCIIAIIIIVALVILRPAPTPQPMLVTNSCTDQTVSSLKAQGEVKDIGAGLLSKRGFVWLEGDSGDPALNLIPLVNPSFEEGSPPTGWSPGGNVSLSRETTIVKLGTASMKIKSNGGKWLYGYQSIPNYANYAGKTVTVGVWCYAPSTNDKEQQLKIEGGAGYSSSGVITKDNAWHWVTLTHIISASPTTLQIQLFSNHSGTSDSDDVLYVDGAILVLGDKINAAFEDGEFSTGTYSLTIEDLEPNTSYRVRAFGENEAGIGYGNTVTCKTLAG